MPHSEDEHSFEQSLLLSGYRYALSLVHHAQDAEDLVQQACLKVFRAKGVLNNKGYFLRAVRNLFYDRCRQRRGTNIASLTDDCLADQAPSPARSVDGRLDLETLLASLSHEQREILYLNCVEGYSAQEISHITGHPRGTVLSHLSRSKEKIRRRHNYQPYPEKAL